MSDKVTRWFSGKSELWIGLSVLLCFSFSNLAMGCLSRKDEVGDGRPSPSIGPLLCVDSQTLEFKFFFKCFLMMGNLKVFPFHLPERIVTLCPVLGVNKYVLLNSCFTLKNSSSDGLRNSFAWNVFRFVCEQEWLITDTRFPLSLFCLFWCRVVQAHWTLSELNIWGFRLLNVTAVTHSWPFLASKGAGHHSTPHPWSTMGPWWRSGFWRQRTQLDSWIHLGLAVWLGTSSSTSLFLKFLVC